MKDLKNKNIRTEDHSSTQVSRPRPWHLDLVTENKVFVNWSQHQDSKPDYKTAIFHVSLKGTETV